MLTDNGLGAFVEQLGQAKLRQFGQYLREFFDGIAAASPAELPFVMRDDVPALLNGLVKAMDGYDQAFTEEGSPYAENVEIVRAKLNELINSIRSTFTTSVEGKQRQGASLYTAKTSQFSDMLSAGVTQLPPQMIPNIMQAIGDYFTDTFKSTFWALDVQLSNLSDNELALRQAVIRSEVYFTQSFYSMVRTLKSKA